MSKTKCPYCKDFNEEEYNIDICEVIIQGGYYNYHCPIYYCPNCGKKLKKYSKEDSYVNKAEA